MDDVKVGGIVYPIEIKEDFTGDTGDCIKCLQIMIFRF